MKKIYFILYAMAVASLFSACSDHLENNQDEDRRIQVRAGVSELQVSARNVVEADPFLGDFPTEGNELQTAIWFSAESGVFEHSPETNKDTHIPIRTTVHFDNDGWKYPVQYKNDDLRYPSNGSSIYCVGLYPIDHKTENTRQWQLDAACSTAFRNINGEDDLMFAKQIEGRWGQPFPVMQFKHLQTWIKICICATSRDAIDVWGKIEKITIGSNTLLTITNLVDGTTTYTVPGTFIAMENNATNLGITIAEVGNLFCSPPYKYQEIEEGGVKKNVYGYQLTIETEKQGSHEVFVPIRDVDTDTYEETWVTNSDNTIGKLYNLCLYFHEFGVVDGICILKSWDDQNENLYPNS